MGIQPLNEPDPNSLRGKENPDGMPNTFKPTPVVQGDKGPTKQSQGSELAAWLCCKTLSCQSLLPGKADASEANGSADQCLADELALQP